MSELHTPQEVKAGRLAYEKDRREHKHWQPHWEEISHTERLHWIVCAKGKNVPKPLPPQGSVVVVSG